MEKKESILTIDGYNDRAGLCIWNNVLEHIFTAERPYPVEEEQREANAQRLVLAWKIFPLTVEALDSIIASKTLKEAKSHARKIMSQMQDS